METGIYEQIVNTLFQNKLSELDAETFYVGKKKLNKNEAAKFLSRYLYQLFQKVFTLLPDNEVAVTRCIEFTNDVIRKLGQDFNISDYNNDLVYAQSEILTSIIDKSKCDYPDIETYLREATPITSLSTSTLFTGRGEHITMSSELKKEILSSDEICLVVSFIKKSGLNLIYKELKDFTKTRKLRVITTTYMQATDFDAVVMLANLPNTEVKISYSGEVDRLHAKGYIFLRNSGFHTAYIGSSNISNPALREGLEWNLKVTQVELPYIIQAIKNSFESYWNDETFVDFHPGIDDDRLKFALGLNTYDGLDYSFLNLMRPKDYQRAILEKLDVERNVHGHFRNLVVAATGTGKTVIAAFDYKRFREANPEHNNFLFIVHREEIIKQACFTFRQILGDQNFGDMWYGGHETDNFSHLFASKDMLNSRLDTLSLAEDYYDYIIVDEVHHLAADSYRKILKKFKPRILLGLTATPERMDGQDITEDFDGHISAEIRLTDALNSNLLAPFHYYGITDNVDLSEVRWERGHFVPSELSKLYTYNDQRTALIFDKVQEYLDDYNKVRALCFCVDKEHAKYMNAKFTLAGLKSGILTSDDTKEHRKRMRNELRQRKINYLFVVDIFNEGVDIPEIDTILFLRPTESLTVFLQQFGRGLRLSPGKDHLTVLDFVGHCRSEFNYLARFRALIGATSMSVPEEISSDFPHLPMKCHIQLERKAKDYILENIKKFIKSMNTNHIVALIKDFHLDYTMPLTLRNFIKATLIPLERIYRAGTWNELCVKAGVESVNSLFNVPLRRAVNRKWLSTDSYSYFQFILRLAKSRFTIKESDLNSIEKKQALMLYYDLFETADVFPSLQDMFNALQKDNLFIDELHEVVSYLSERCNADEKADNSSIMNFPLKLHGVYTKGQIQVALGNSTIDKKSSTREGVERNKSINVEAMYVDIIKVREEGSNTNYNDYARSRYLFNWETQNSASPDSSAGKNYINESQTMLLFVRQQASHPDDKTRTMGYVYLGKVRLEEWSGSKPMNIVWRLSEPMPESTYMFAATHKAIG